MGHMPISIYRHLVGRRLYTNLEKEQITMQGHVQRRINHVAIEVKKVF